MDFRDAVQALGRACTQQQIADALGVSWHSVKQAALPADSPAHRTPPPGWEPVLAKLARRKGRELAKLADALEPEAR